MDPTDFFLFLVSGQSNPAAKTMSQTLGAVLPIWSAMLLPSQLYWDAVANAMVKA